MFEGLGSDEATDLLPCFTDCNSAASDFAEAANLLKDHPDAIHVISGLGKLGSGLHEMVSAMDECKASVENIAKINKTIKELKDVKSIVFHAGKDLVINRV